MDTAPYTLAVLLCSNLTFFQSYTLITLPEVFIVILVGAHVSVFVEGDWELAKT